MYCLGLIVDMLSANQNAEIFVCILLDVEFTRQAETRRNQMVCSLMSRASAQTMETFSKSAVKI